MMAGCIDRRSKESTEAHVAAWFGYADALATVLRQLPSEELRRISYFVLISVISFRFYMF